MSAQTGWIISPTGNPAASSRDLSEDLIHLGWKDGQKCTKCERVMPATTDYFYRDGIYERLRQICRKCHQDERRKRTGVESRGEIAETRRRIAEAADKLGDMSTRQRCGITGVSVIQSQLERNQKSKLRPIAKRLRVISRDSREHILEWFRKELLA